MVTETARAQLHDPISGAGILPISASMFATTSDPSSGIAPVAWLDVEQPGARGVETLSQFPLPPQSDPGGPAAYYGQDAPALPPPDPSLYGPASQPSPFYPPAYAAPYSPQPLYEQPVVPPPEPITDFKQGFFQKLEFTATWLPRGGGDEGLGWSRLDTRLSVGLPAPTIEWPMLVTPGFTVYYLDGPEATDLPARLYEGTLQFMWLPKLSERWRLILMATPGVYGDLEQTDSRARRFTGFGLAAYDWKPGRVKLILGVVYLDRDDFNLLPAAGAIWTPNDNVEIEAVMPRPRAGWRWRYGSGFEDWLYVAGEIGGGTWQIERQDSTSDRLTIRDFRIILGAERRRNGGAGHRLEIGYVFGRDIEFRTDPQTFSPPDTLLLRAGIAF